MTAARLISHYKAGNIKMEDFFRKYSIEKEARISIVLNTFMYTDRCPEIKNGRTLTVGKAVAEMFCGETRSKLNPSQKGALHILKQYLDRPENSDISGLIVEGFSNHMGSEYTGAYAATFRTANMSEVYVVFRGTGEGRWYDNGDALARECSQYQKTAEKYFNHMIEALNPGADTVLTVTGHSKGGNLSQYVTLVSPYRNRVTHCISFDGEGFSPEFLRSLGVSVDIARISSINPSWVPYYIPIGIRQQIYKMYSVCGDNDYVNVLGIKIIPDSRTVYIETDCAVTDVVASHAISPSYTEGIEGGMTAVSRNRYFFNWDKSRFNRQTEKTRALSDIFRNVSSYIMNETQEVREKDCHAMMDVLEAVMSRRDTGLMGENAFSDEYMELMKAVPKVFMIAEVTLLDSMIPKKQKNLVKNQIKLFNAAVEIIREELKKH